MGIEYYLMSGGGYICGYKMQRELGGGYIVYVIRVGYM